MSEYSAGEVQLIGDVVKTTGNEYKDTYVPKKIAACISDYIERQVGPDATKTENYDSITAVQGTGKAGQILNVQIPKEYNPSQTYISTSGGDSTPEPDDTKHSPEHSPKYSQENLKKMTVDGLKEAGKALSGTIDDFLNSQGHSKNQDKEPVKEAANKTSNRTGDLNEALKSRNETNPKDQDAYHNLAKATQDCITPPPDMPQP